MECQEHRWKWSDDRQAWICLDCGQVAADTNPLIEPCLVCGGSADASETLCENCNG